MQDIFRNSEGSDVIVFDSAISELDLKIKTENNS